MGRLSTVRDIGDILKTLPYFLWYPADAETDEGYSSLTDAELGFFHRCLNRAWLNDGLPADLDDLARAMNRTRNQLEKVWPRVSKLFQSRESDGRLVNRRQEEERENARRKSLNLQRNGNANALKGVPSASTRASESVSASGFVSFPKGSGALNPKHSKTYSMRFSEWWARYPLKTQENLCAGVWIGLVTVDLESVVFACLDRYLASDMVARKIIMSPERWLHDCSRDGWRSDWPAAGKPNGSAARHDEAIEIAERIAEQKRRFSV